MGVLPRCRSFIAASAGPAMRCGDLLGHFIGTEMSGAEVCASAGADLRHSEMAVRARPSGASSDKVGSDHALAVALLAGSLCPLSVSNPRARLYAPTPAAAGWARVWARRWAKRAQEGMTMAYIFKEDELPTLVSVT